MTNTSNVKLLVLSPAPIGQPRGATQQSEKWLRVAPILPAVGERCGDPGSTT